MDLLASHQAGWGNTVAVSGTAFTPEHAALIRRLTDNLVIALDPDQAGIKAAGRASRAALSGGLNVKVAQLPSGLDPADLILKEGAEAWKKEIREAKDIITFLLDVLEEHAPQKDRFRRVVESVVLPFLSDVQSPIAREQYIREIARRLDVSEGAVADAFARVPSIAGGEHTARPAMELAKPSFTQGFGRARQAYSILLWQKTLPKPAIDLKAYERDMEEAIGAESLSALQALPESEQESLRFSAEHLYGKSSALLREAEALLDIILKEQLSEELAFATTALKRAEAARNEAEIEKLMISTQLLTGRIAKLHKKV